MPARSIKIMERVIGEGHQAVCGMQMSEDDLFPMECPRCHYVVTWFPRQAGFATALGMYTKCHEMTERLDLSPEDRGRYCDEPRHCGAMRDAWVRIMREKMPSNS
jgi:hypothetical protein